MTLALIKIRLSLMAWTVISFGLKAQPTSTARCMRRVPPASSRKIGTPNFIVEGVSSVEGLPTAVPGGDDLARLPGAAAVAAAGGVPWKECDGLGPADVLRGKDLDDEWCDDMVA